MNKPITVMTSNICCWGKGENSVAKRQPRIKEIYKKYLPDLIGTQETTLIWKNYLTEALPEYGVVGEARDDYEGNGEHCVILYRKEKFDLVKTETFALSESGEFGSLGWGEEYPRICNYAVLRDKESGEQIAFFNTHLALLDDARANMLKLIFTKIKEIGLPTILTGDFNTSENTESYNLCLELLDDIKFIAAKTENGYTWHAYEEENLPESEKHTRYNGSPIDYCMCSKGVFDAESYEIIRDKASDGNPISDHYPVIVKLSLK